MRLIESMNSFQAMTRKEIGMLQNRMAYIEQLVEKISKTIDKSISNINAILDAATTYSQAVPMTTESESTGGNKPPAKKQEVIWNKVLEYIRVTPNIYIKYRARDIMTFIIGFWERKTIYC